MNTDDDIVLESLSRKGRGKVLFYRSGNVFHGDRGDCYSATFRERFATECAKLIGEPGIKVEIEGLILRKLRTWEEEQRQAAAAPDDGEPEADVYRMLSTGIVWQRKTRDGSVDTPLTNFTARIITQVMRDDGAEREQQFEIEAEVKGRISTFSVPVSRFASIESWAMEHLGAGGIVYAGPGFRDHTRAAIQILSTDVKTRTVYAHTGWRVIGETPVFLHAGGGIDANGARTDVEVDLPEALSGFVLPAPPEGEELTDAVRSSLRMLDGLAPDSVVMPIYCAPWRAVLGCLDFSVGLSGISGVFKTEKAALLQQHFGQHLDARHLPASWSSTENALEAIAFSAKDVLLTIDDFAPVGSTADVQQLHKRADRIIRGQGNHSGRQRLRVDGTIRPTKPPRCLPFITGEEIPSGQSLQARLCSVEVSPGNVVVSRLSECQADAARGDYAKAMAGYIRWLASPEGRKNPSTGRMRSETTNRATDDQTSTSNGDGRGGRIGRFLQTYKGDIARLRAQVGASTAHRRTPDLISNLALGFKMFLRFALHTGAVTRAEVDALWARAWAALCGVGERQTAFQRSADPVNRFLELLASAIASGAAHVAGTDGTDPKSASGWGWRRRPVGTIGEVWESQGARIGWTDGTDLFLDSDSAYKAANLMASNGDGILIRPNTLRKRLAEKGLLKIENPGDLTVRKVIEGKRQRVICLDARILFEKPVQSVQSVQSAENANNNGELYGTDFQNSESQAVQSGHQGGVR